MMKPNYKPTKWQAYEQVVANCSCFNTGCKRPYSQHVPTFFVELKILPASCNCFGVQFIFKAASKQNCDRYYSPNWMQCVRQLCSIEWACGKQINSRDRFIGLACEGAQVVFCPIALIYVRSKTTMKTVLTKYFFSACSCLIIKLLG